MNSQIYDDIALERIAKERFGVDFEVRQVVVRNVPVSRTAQATVFLTTKKQLYVYIGAESKLLLGDIRKILTRMGLKPELFIPPKGRPQYFDEIGRSKFKEVFPGRTPASDQDIAFYRTLAPYNPALVLVGEVKNGEISQFDSDAHGEWRVAAKFAYRRIRTS